MYVSNAFNILKNRITDNNARTKTKINLKGV
jgi:hypothetical protein